MPTQDFRQGAFDQSNELPVLIQDLAKHNTLFINVCNFKEQRELAIATMTLRNTITELAKFAGVIMLENGMEKPVKRVHLLCGFGHSRQAESVGPAKKPSEKPGFRLSLIHI